MTKKKNNSKVTKKKNNSEKKKNSKVTEGKELGDDREEKLSRMTKG
jgi:hypothetical protein